VSGEAPLNLLWLQSGGCGGCTLSLLGAECPDLLQALEESNIALLWHPSLAEATGQELIPLLEACIAGEQRLDILCIEGAMLRGPNGSGRFHLLAGTGQPMTRWVARLAAVARHTVAVGTCAAYGGISRGEDNLLDACGLQYEGGVAGGLLGERYRSAAGGVVVNIAGCPTHPDWVVEGLAAIAHGTPLALDDLGRPRFYADHLVHHGCPRNEYYEFKASAQALSELGCLMENLGCKGTQAHADCNLRYWNGSGSCLRGGYPCINCTAPEFSLPGHPFQQTPKVAGIPIGLPTDMPKAWFVALASLSKSATPKRVRQNAHADHIVLPPTLGRQKR